MTRLERSERFLHQTGRSGLRILLPALFAASGYAATISNFQTFDVSGFFDEGAGYYSNGSTLNGDLVININSAGNNAIFSGDLFVTPNILPADSGPESVEFTNLDSQGISGTGPYSYTATFDDGNADYLTLVFDLNGASSMFGYSGGNLCSDTDSGCPGGESSTTLGSDPNLYVGTAVNATPEPSSTLLLFSGATVLMGLRQRKRRA